MLAEVTLSFWPSIVLLSLAQGAVVAAPRAGGIRSLRLPRGPRLAPLPPDTALVVAQLLQRPNNALNAAHPAAGLPRLQSAVLGSATMGYGDLFIAGALGALLAGELGRSLQLRAAALTALLAIAFDLFFLV